MKKTDVLVYTAGATERTVTEAEWAQAGIKNQGTTTWSKKNNWRMLVGDVDPDALSLLLELHGNEFRIMDAADAKKAPSVEDVPASAAPTPTARNASQN